MGERKTRLLVTGMAGFVGSHLWEHTMKTTDWDVVGLVKMDRAGDLNRIQETLNDHPEYLSRTKIVRHDLNDSLNTVHKHIGEVDYIAHLAACSHVDVSIADPVGVFVNNAKSTVNMLEYARTKQPNLKKFLTSLRMKSTVLLLRVTILQRMTSLGRAIRIVQVRPLGK